MQSKHETLIPVGTNIVYCSNALKFIKISAVRQNRISSSANRSEQLKGLLISLSLRPKHEYTAAPFGPAKYLRQPEAAIEDGLFFGPAKDLLQPEAA